MNRLNKIEPYSDDKLTWNDKTNQYELAFEFCKEEYPQNFRDDDTLKQRIKKNSKTVYNFMLSRINSYNRYLALSMLSNTEEGRNFVFEMLRTQFDSDVDSGYKDLGMSPAVNLSNGQIIPREELQRNLVSVATEQVWDNNQAYFGINLGYQAQFPTYYFLFLRK